jgi:hypothetical protein
VLGDVLELHDTPYISGYRIWRHELPWHAKNVTRLGYLLMATPDERSVAQPGGDFYLYFLPWRRPPDAKDRKPDEVFFHISESADEFFLTLRRYAAASLLRSESTFSYRRGYDQPLHSMWAQLGHWLRRDFDEAISVTCMDTTRALAEWSSSGAEKKARPREQVETAAAALLISHFESRYPGYPVFENAIIPTAASGKDRVPLHPWFAVRRRPMAELAVQLARAASGTEDPSLSRDSSGNPRRFLDLCSGVATIAEAAAQLGFAATAVDSSPVATLIARSRLDYERDPLLLARATGWAGLLEEVTQAANRLLVAAQATAGSSWLAEINGVLLVATATCLSCSADVPEVNDVHLGSGVHATAASELGKLTFVVGQRPKGGRRAIRLCPRCGTQLARIPGGPGRHVPAAIATGRGREWIWAAVPPTSNFNGLHVNAEFPFPSSHSVFTRVRSREINWAMLTSPRQRAILAALRDAAVEELARTQARDLPPRAAEAIGAQLALLVSSTLPYLTKATVWSASGRLSPALSRTAWSPSSAYVEVGASTIKATWLRRLDEVTAATRHAAQPLVRVRRADARHLEESDGVFDLAIWDPPFYDNVDYDSLASPFEQLLRSIAPEHPDLAGPPCHNTAQRFDADAYRGGLQAMAGEAHRVLTEGGHLGVWWLSRKPDELQNLIDLVAHAGLELRTAVSVDTERGPKSPGHSSHRTYLLVFQKTTAVVPVEAVVVLALADAGPPEPLRRPGKHP